MPWPPTHRSAESLLLSGLLLFIALPARAQVVRTADITVRGIKESDFPRITKLADNVYSYEQLHQGMKVVTTNSLIVVTTDGVLIADGQGNPEHVKRMIADIAKLTTQPIKYVVVGSEHGDHTGGNAAFPQTVTFIAHPFSKANIERQANAPNRPPNAPKIVVPTEVVSDKKVLKMGNTEIDILFLGRAHTGGDLEIYLPRENVIFMSEVFFNRVFPSMASAFPTEWVETIKKAEAMNVRTYVPGHGFVDSPEILKEELVNYRFALERVVSEGTRLHDAKTPVENAPTGADFGSYGNWTRSANNAFAALRRVYMEADGQLK